MEKVYRMAIVGSGPAGLTAAIYAARANLEPVVLAGLEYGGQLMTTSEVENYPGFADGIQGPELMAQMIKQAKRFSATIQYELVKSVDFSQRPFTLTTDNDQYKAESVILATGSSPRTLGLKSESTYWGKGVSSCATCDGAFYKGQKVAVIGGGDSAMEEATFLTHFAEKVYLIHRRDSFRASKIMQERALNHPKIEVIWNTEVLEVLGDATGVTGLQLKNNQTGDESKLEVMGMFLAIGHIPQTNFLDGHIELDSHGFIQTQDGVHTSVQGVFVAGDVADPIYKQAVTAAGMGCKAAIQAEKYLAGL